MLFRSLFSDVAFNAVVGHVNIASLGSTDLGVILVTFHPDTQPPPPFQLSYKGHWHRGVRHGEGEVRVHLFNA